MSVLIRVKATAKLPVEKDPQLGKGRVYRGTPGTIQEFNPPGGTGNTTGTEEAVIQFDAATFDNGTGVPKPVHCTEDQFEVTGVVEQ